MEPIPLQEPKLTGVVNQSKAWLRDREDYLAHNWKEVAGRSAMVSITSMGISTAFQMPLPIAITTSILTGVGNAIGNVVLARRA